MGAQKSTFNVRPRFSSQPMPSIVRDLHLAVMQNDLTKLKLVIASGVDVNYPWINPEQPSIKDGCTALCEAISLNHVEAVKTLIDASACSTFIGCRDWQILFKAVYHGRDAIVKLLFAAGINIRSRDEDGNTALHICAKNSFVHNNARCIVTLLECGSAPNAKNRKGHTPLHLAATWGMTEVAGVLLQCKSYVDSVDNEYANYMTPFYAAVSHLIQRRQASSLSREIFSRHLATIKLLLRHRYKNILKISNDSEFSSWLEMKTPDDLKHLCRLALCIPGKFQEI
uniref:Ankyrin repeat protein n=1 Tax=Romanomermis culicivorax TaxID=13658 RepID=A0A915JM44_ROMCU